MSQEQQSIELRPIGFIRSPIKERSAAPKQGSEGAPDVWIDIEPCFTEALDGFREGDEAVVITWLHRANREVLKVHPRSDPQRRLTGVFATRSPRRPNPIGVTRCRILSIEGDRIRVEGLDARGGSPVVDIKCHIPDPLPPESVRLPAWV